MRPGDRLVCAFVEPAEPGVQFKEWPLHVTVIPWFRAAVDSMQLAEMLKWELGDIKPFKVVMDGEARFGRNKLVNLVHKPTPFEDIEAKVRVALKDYQAWIVDETTKTKRPYRPHVTEQKSGRMQKGDSFKCDKLFIIEQKGGVKEVAAVVELGHGKATA